MSAQMAPKENFCNRCAAFDPLVDSFESDDYKVSRSVTHHVKINGKKTLAYWKYFASPADETALLGMSSD